VRQHFAPAPTLEGDVVLSFLKRKFDSDLEDVAGSVLPESSEGWIYEFDYNEQRLQIGVDLVWQMGDDHRMLFDYAFSRSDLSDVVRPLNPDEAYEGDDRQVNSLRLQEQWQPHDRLLLIGGMGYDHYSDIGGQVSPKVASVFRLNARRSSARRHILKIQYGRAFRPPTFLETHAALNAANPEPETIDTLEVGYVTRKFEETFRITVFSSKLTADIDTVPGERETYDIRGLELEYSKPLLPDILGLDANLSYAKTENRDTGEKISGSADWLSNIGLSYTPFRWLSLSLQLHSVFHRNGDIFTEAGRSDDTHLLDATARLRFPKNQDWTLHLGVKNVFKEDIRLYSLQTDGDGVNNVVAPGDDRPSRFLWMSLSYDF